MLFDRPASNPIYAGQIGHKGRIHQGQHVPIVDPIIWDEVQRQLASNTRLRRNRSAAAEHILTGRIRDERGHPMSPTHTAKGSRRYRYYISTSPKIEGPAIRRIAAAEIEDAVTDAIARHTRSDLTGINLIDAHLRHATVRPGLIEIELTDDRLLQCEWSPTPSRRRREIVLPSSAPRPSGR